MLYSFLLKEPNIQMQNRVITLIKTQSRVVFQSKQSGIYFYYDTFDWRLYLKGIYLYRAGGELVLYDFCKKTVLISEPFEREITNETLDIPVKIKKRISYLIGIRKLLEVAIFQKNVQVFHLLNIDQKTIARMIIEQNKIKSGKSLGRLNPFFEFHPLRGYDRDIKSILKTIPKKYMASTNENLLQQGLDLLKKIPGSYTSKFKIALPPDLSADKAVKMIYLHLLQTMKLNEYGIIKDFDTEFLHDFRVSVRRTRSGLSQLKNIFNQEAILKAKQDFSYLGQATNKMRDIDVYLLKETEYRKMLPVQMREGLDPFFLFLKIERNKEHQRLVRLLRSKKYKNIVHYWEVFLKMKDATGNSEIKDVRPVIDVAREVIRRRNQRIVKFGKEILQSTSDELLHKLRIEAKKLRYLMEFFSSLFPQKHIQELILKLKQLQDNLGDFNDLIIQQNSLKNFSESLPLDGDLNRNTILTLGILMGKIHEKEKILKKSFAGKFNLYIDKPVQKKFRQLFGVSEKGVQ